MGKRIKEPYARNATNEITLHWDAEARDIAHVFLLLSSPDSCSDAPPLKSRRLATESPVLMAPLLKWSIGNRLPPACTPASTPAEPGSAMRTSRTRSLSARLPATQSRACSSDCSVAFATDRASSLREPPTCEREKRKRSPTGRLLATRRRVGRRWGRRIVGPGFPTP